MSAGCLVSAVVALGLGACGSSTSATTSTAAATTSVPTTAGASAPVDAATQHYLDVVNADYAAVHNAEGGYGLRCAMGGLSGAVVAACGTAAQAVHTTAAQFAHDLGQLSAPTAYATVDGQLRGVVDQTVAAADVATKAAASGSPTLPRDLLGLTDGLQQAIEAMSAIATAP